MADWIEARAKQILLQTDALRAPVPVDAVAHRLGLELNGAALGDDISGVLVIEGESAMIGFNRSDAPVRQRFTIAHELGHFILHRDKRDGVFIDKGYAAVFKRDPKSARGDSLLEIQANQFAAALLMPAELVREAAKKLTFELTDERALMELARQFGVSAQAMSFRLANLGVFAS